MPIGNRSIKPVYVSAIKVPPDVDDHFLYIFNATLSNFIKQISCLTLKAHDIFGELTTSLNKFVSRTETLEAKIERINGTIIELNPTPNEPVLVNSPVLIYRSFIDCDDELLDHSLMPDCIKEMFDEAEPPPELFKLDEFRKKDEESMKFYTDPDFFLREWLKNARNERKKKKEKNKRRKSTHVADRQNIFPPLPPPMMIDTIIQEPMQDNTSLDYNFGDVAVYEDPTMFKMSLDANNTNISANNAAEELPAVAPMPLHPLPPPPPILVNFPSTLPPAPPAPPQPLKAPTPTVSNLFADIQKGTILKPVKARDDVTQTKDTKEKTKDLREFIDVIRTAWHGASDDESDESDD